MVGRPHQSALSHYQHARVLDTELVRSAQSWRLPVVAATHERHAPFSSSSHHRGLCWRASVRDLWVRVHNAGPARAAGRQGLRHSKRGTRGEPLLSVCAGQGGGHAPDAMRPPGAPGLRAMCLGGGSGPGPLPRPGTQLRPQEPPCAGCAAADSGPAVTLTASRRRAALLQPGRGSSAASRPQPRSKPVGAGPRDSPSTWSVSTVAPRRRGR
jgi:hypothetical protein